MGATQSIRNNSMAKDLSLILKKTCDDKSLILFESIAISDGNGYIPLREMNLTVRQYYSRLSALMNAGMVKRQKGKYSLTILGKLVREAYAVIGQALNEYWKINALESIESSNSRVPKQELMKLVDSLIDNHKIKEMIIDILLESERNSVSPPNQQIERSGARLPPRNLADIEPVSQKSLSRLIYDK
jgi:predicted transcriptional regulator